MISPVTPAPPTGLRPWARMWHALAAGAWDGCLTNTQILKFTTSNGDDMDVIAGYQDYDA